MTLAWVLGVTDNSSLFYMIPSQICHYSEQWLIEYGFSKRFDVKL